MDVDDTDSDGGSEREPGTASDEGGEGTEGADRDATALDDGPDRPLGTAVVTIASSRSLDSDEAGEAIVTALEEAGHELATREHVSPDHDRVQSIVLRLIERDDVDVVITAGATSVEPDDVVIEAVEPLLDKELTAFQDLFTSMAYEEVGTRVLASRTLAGVSEGKPVFCLPGHADAARLGTESIILPEARNLVAVAAPVPEEGEEEEEDDEETDGTAETDDSSR
ncbi:molybdenum cofactor biosynthesis protein [Halobiforma lacisalsi AJ5]|uniref:Molybdenum cofactor biosynthesis protein n=1 Tax=Natronobacterium lacisalsi AJ5 TaxID=358396 RepID=M0LH86_NATLA|nr:molybdopterin-binding protein [Halobiforma lacisalsi]APW96435.1 molybdenum cofactor biosynthesis protein [Halobiforma lacisalsi AJ5]EMA31794.1 molybdenum cofactor synthesis domain-containing protein [Halobiforma lacisalsi AJ5]